MLAAACSSSLQTPSPDGGTDGATPTPDGGSTDAAGGSCEGLQQAYSAALSLAQECTVGASGQCSVQVRAGFFCNCTTWANGGADALAAMLAQYKAAGCQTVCNGICVQPQALTCLADATSSTGGRCLPPTLLNLDGTNDGGSFPVPVGYEIDILLQNIASNGYGQDVLLSSDAATVLEVTIPAGPVNPGGPQHLYRLRALSPGQVVVQIPFVSVTDDAGHAAYTITLDIH